MIDMPPPPPEPVADPSLWTGLATSRLPDPGITENGLHHSMPTLTPGQWGAELRRGRVGWVIRFRQGGSELIWDEDCQPRALTLTGARRRARRHLRRRNGEARRQTWYVTEG